MQTAAGPDPPVTLTAVPDRRLRGIHWAPWAVARNPDGPRDQSVYDINDNSARVSVGVDHDTAQFAAAAIRAWWEKMGRQKYPDARRLMITADCGGSNGNRPWLWKQELAKFAAEPDMEITICHFPSAARTSLSVRGPGCVRMMAHPVSTAPRWLRSKSTG